jgi:hypothetical protein
MLRCGFDVVFVCMYVCMCICCVDICLYVYLFMWMYVCMCLFLCCDYAGVDYVYVYTLYVHMNMCVRMYAHIRTYKKRVLDS